jgi:hypothetical protein
VPQSGDTPVGNIYSSPYWTKLTSILAAIASLAAVALYGITWGSIVTTQVTPARLFFMRMSISLRIYVQCFSFKKKVPTDLVSFELHNVKLGLRERLD